MEKKQRVVVDVFLYRDKSGRDPNVLGKQPEAAGSGAAVTTVLIMSGGRVTFKNPTKGH